MLKIFVKSILPLKVANLISNVLSGRNNVSWQASKKNSSLKPELIRPILDQYQVRNVLDIGCNVGQVSRSVSKNRFVSAEQISYLDETPESQARKPLRYMPAVSCSNG